MAVDSVARVISLSSLEGGYTDSDIIVEEAVGRIPAGTFYPEGTPVSRIIHDMFHGVPAPKQLTIYYGATDNPPTSVAGLTSKSISSSALIGEYAQNIKAGNKTTKKGQYPVFAIPTGYKVNKWYVPGFEYDIPHTLIVKGGYNIYYLNVPSYDEDEGGIDYLLTVREV